MKFPRWGLCIALALTSSVRASDRPSAATLRSAFEAQFPKTGASAPALELERLAASLGINLAPRDAAAAGEAPSGEDAEPAPFALKAESARARPSAEAQAAFFRIMGAVSQLLERELKSADERIAEPPPEVERYFSEHEGLLSAAESLLLREKDVRWEMDFSRPEAAPLPNLLGIMQLQRLFVARALLQERDSETDAALRTLEAAWRLNEVVSSRPELISQLITIAAAKLHVGTLRKLNDPAPGWADRLRDGDLYARFLAAFQNQAWQTSPDVQDLTGERGAFGRVLRTVVAEFQEGDLCSWTAEKLQETWTRAARDESREEETLAEIGVPNLVDSFLRWRRHRIDSELTALVLDARGERAASPRKTWPASLAGVGTRICPNEPWSYRPARNGTATFAFEGRISESSAPFRLPLRFTAGTLSKAVTQAEQERSPGRRQR